MKCAGRLITINILHCVHRYRPTIGGSEQYMIDLSEHLSARGHHVTVYTSRALSSDTWKNALPRKEMVNGVDVRRFSSITRTRLLWGLMHYGYRRYPRKKDLLAQRSILLGNGPVSPSWAMVPWTSKETYDVVHTTALPYSHVVYAHCYARKKNIPFVMTPFIHVAQRDVFDVEYFFRTLRSADAVIAATDYERDYLISRGIPEEKLHTIGLGVDLDELNRLEGISFKDKMGMKEDDRYILFLGRKEYYKGIDVLIRAFNSLKKDYPGLHLVLAGPRTPYSQQLMCGLQDKERILETGTLTEACKNSALKSASIMVLPSVHESFGIVFIESWAFGNPVIGARSGAIADVVRDGHDGLLFEPGDAPDLESKMQALLDDPARSQAMGNNGYNKVVQRYTKDKIADRVEAVYCSVSKGC